jgi:N-acetylglucosaminyl-diphospho-decaprenol L-rhamnosyltransferase
VILWAGLPAALATLSVVIVNWNAGAALGECLGALFASEPTGAPLEVVVVDNASTDGSEAQALLDRSDVRLIQNRENVGFARAANQGLRAVAGELTMLLNPDVVVAPPALRRLVGFMLDHPAAAAAGPRLLNPDGSIQGSARRDPSPWTGLFGRTTLLTRLFPDNRLSQRELPALGQRGEVALEVDWISGACLLARRAAYERVGLLDEQFFLFWEDADWCRRFRRAGWRVYYVPAACGTHRVGVSRSHRRLRSEIDFHRSAYRYYRKHHPVSASHPMMVLLAAGLLGSAAVRLLRATCARDRESGAR